MTTFHGRVEPPESIYGAASAEIGGRIANPIVCALNGLIEAGWKGAGIGLALAPGALVLEPTASSLANIRFDEREGRHWRGELELASDRGRLQVAWKLSINRLPNPPGESQCPILIAAPH